MPKKKKKSGAANQGRNASAASAGADDDEAALNEALAAVELSAVDTAGAGKPTLEPVPLSETIFDAELSRALIAATKKQHGCFACGASGARQVCSACGFACYCSQACARLDWKGKNMPETRTVLYTCHKEACTIWNENRGVQRHSLGDSGGFPTALNLRGLHLINDEDLDCAVAEREALFLQDLRRRATEGGQQGSAKFCMAAAVTFQLGSVRLSGSCSFFDRGGVDRGVRQVQHVLFATVDAGEEAKARISAPPSGALSAVALARAGAVFEGFAQRWRAAGCELTGITLGRGFVEHVDDEALRAQIGMKAGLVQLGANHTPGHPFMGMGR
jgi:hypothetical protein